MALQASTVRRVETLLAPRGELRALAAWLLGLRWVAVAALVVVVVLSTSVSHRVGEGAAAGLYGLVGVLAAFNAALSVAGPSRLASELALGLQIGGDVLILGGLVHLAGGIANPFSGFFVFHAVIASLVLKPTQAARFAAFIAGFVLLLTAAEASGWLAPSCLRDARGICQPAGDALELLAYGLGVSVLVAGCAAIVIALHAQSRRDRDELREATEQLAAEAARLDGARSELAVAQEKLQSIVQCMADAVIFATPDGKVLLHNKAAAELWQGEAQVPLHALEVCHTPASWAAVMAKVQDPAPIEEHPVLQLNGRAYEATYARVSGPAEELYGVVMVARDITERLAEQASHVQRERMATVGRLAAALAHELNNPLGAIALFTQHALKHLDPGVPLADHLGTVMRNANLCKKIVRDLLEYARQRPPERRELEVRDLLDDVVRTLQPQGQQSRILLVTVVHEGVSRPIFGDPDQLRQVLVNLGLNAIDAMPDGGRLVFAVDRLPDGGVRIDVRDTGSGIAPEELERVFQPFHTTKAEGTGLGLAVARDLVAAHGGRIDLTSDLGRGSTFSVLLPAALEVAGEAA
ncbi:MAG: hypothetical protein IT371_27815 [Deltaproteobacteria bacterium]|nr:hypothetical protein [Deltaproteobacteria bacterium]